MKKIRILGALLRKEFKIIGSNPLMPKVMLIMPIMVMQLQDMPSNLLD